VSFIGLPLLALVARAAAAEDFFASLTSPIALQALRLSLVTSVISMAVILTAGTLIAYTLARRPSRLTRAVDLVIDLSLVLPPVVVGLAMLMAFGRRGLLGGALEAFGVTLPFTTAAVVMAQVIVAAPFYVRSAKLGFQGVPQELEELAQTLGHSPWRTFLRVTLPLAWPALTSGLALSWARALSEFGATIMFAGNFMGRTQTMPLAILFAMETNVSTALALAVLLLGASFIVLVVLTLAARSGPAGARG
jgi:molybdate transport system permease protein